MAKTYRWVAGKLALLEEGSSQQAWDLLDLFCNGKLVSPTLTIAAVQECLWRNRPTEGQDAMLVLEYDVHPTPRSRERVAV